MKTPLNAALLVRTRIEQGLSQTQLASKAGMSRQTLCNAERGRSNLTPQNLQKVATALNKQISDLLLADSADAK
ncbi:helix-turn-helix transcriptional regulator [Streptomyces sp. NPDC090306]|uniref:helix-turn-helix transcriptional regulator n=1 Tax=Streptomyces sp. NPDC090306 TaxID=3365961 RepID=UPI003814DBDE